MKEATREEWKALYEAALAFRAQEPWLLFRDDQLFAIEDQEFGETAYCSIIGYYGQLVGITAYLGDQGLKNIMDLSEGLKDEELFFTQQCLALTWEDRKDQKKRDLETIRELGFKFRGKGQWPLFRDYSPGKEPWYLTGEQCRFFTRILQETVKIAEDFQQEKITLPDLFATEQLYFRVRAEDGKWREEVRELDLTWPYTILEIADELLVRRLKKLGSRLGGSLEVETFYCPVEVGERGERAFYPKMCLFVERNSGLVVNHKNYEDAQEEQECLEGLIELIQTQEALPNQIYVRQKKVYYLFKKVCRQLGIELTLVEELAQTEYVKADLFSFFG